MRKTLIGIVVSDKMSKTRTVKVERSFPHPKYGKIVRQTVSCHVHDEKELSREGDCVKIIESRPMSRLKRWALIAIVDQKSESSSATSVTPMENSVAKRNASIPKLPEVATRPSVRRSSEIKEHRMQLDSTCQLSLLANDHKLIAELRYWTTDYTVTTTWRTPAAAARQVNLSTFLADSFSKAWIVLHFGLDRVSQLETRDHSVLTNRFRVRSESPLVLEVSNKDTSFSLPDKSTFRLLSLLAVTLESEKCDIHLAYSDLEEPTVTCKMIPLSTWDNTLSALIENFPISDSDDSIKSQIRSWCDEASHRCRRELRMAASKKEDVDASC